MPNVLIIASKTHHQFNTMCHITVLCKTFLEPAI